MGFLDNLKASVGKDTAEIEVDLQQRPHKRGDMLKALVRVKGGKNNQKMRYLRISIEYNGHFSFPSTDAIHINCEGVGRIWYGDWAGTVDVMVQAGKTLEYPIELKIPSDSPLSTDKLKYKFYVRADIDDAKDPEYATNFD